MRTSLAIGLALFAGLAAPAWAADPVPPTPKQIIRVLLANADVPLTVDPSCKGVGSDFKDRTIGDYVSGFLAAQLGDGGKNWIETSAKPREAPEQGKPLVWACNVVIRRQHGEEEWGWGVSFAMRASDRRAIRTSFRCTGGG